jgi:hypothetical protein
MKDMNGPSVRGAVFEGTLQDYPTRPGPMFDGEGFGRLPIMSFVDAPDEFDYSHDVSYDYYRDTSAPDFKVPPQYTNSSGGTLTGTMNVSGSRGGTLTPGYTFEIIDPVKHTFVTDPATPGPNYFTVDPQTHSIRTIVMGPVSYM